MKLGLFALCCLLCVVIATSIPPHLLEVYRETRDIQVRNDSLAESTNVTFVEKKGGGDGGGGGGGAHGGGEGGSDSGGEDGSTSARPGGASGGGVGGGGRSGAVTVDTRSTPILILGVLVVMIWESL